MLELLLEPFLYNYVFYSLLVATIIGAATAFVSVYLIASGWSLLGDALSHAVVPGVALSYIFAAPYVIGANIAAIIAIIIMQLLKKFTILKKDAILGLVFTSFLSYGLIIASIYPREIRITTILFGNLLTLNNQEIIQTIAITITIMFIIAILRKNLMLLFLDEIQAKIVGINITLLKNIFFLLLCMIIISALQSIGALLIVSMLITPGATASLLSDDFNKVTIIAIIIGIFTGFIGAYISYFLNVPTSAMIVVMQGALFFITFIFAPKYGLLKKYLRMKKYAKIS
ncbi:metal ABC transporter permease [Bartonella sp. DGB1]|uniref:metal ABC transporter permease n=1 Tax=Bartonella sp. DGB1 TaxID=3239807 RepID=UPI00352446A1